MLGNFAALGCILLSHRVRSDEFLIQATDYFRAYLVGL